MSEEILEKAAAPGVFAAGGVGGVTNPAAGNVGNVPGGYLGLTTGPNAVNPSGTAGGGILQPQQSKQLLIMFGMQLILPRMVVRSSCVQTQQKLRS